MLAATLITEGVCESPAAFAARLVPGAPVVAAELLASFAPGSCGAGVAATGVCVACAAGDGACDFDAAKAAEPRLALRAEATCFACHAMPKVAASRTDAAIPMV